MNDVVLQGTYPNDRTYGNTQEEIKERIKRELASQIDFDNDPDYDYQINLGEGVENFEDGFEDGYTVTRTPAVYRQTDEVVGTVLDDQMMRNETIEEFIARTTNYDVTGHEYGYRYTGADNLGDENVNEIEIVRMERVKPETITNSQTVSPEVTVDNVVDEDIQLPGVITPEENEVAPVEENNEVIEVAPNEYREIVEPTELQQTEQSRNNQVDPAALTSALGAAVRTISDSLQTIRENTNTPSEEQIEVPESAEEEVAEEVAEEVIENPVVEENNVASAPSVADPTPTPVPNANPTSDAQTSVQADEDLENEILSSYINIDYIDNPLVGFDNLVSQFLTNIASYTEGMTKIDDQLRIAEDKYGEIDDLVISAEEFYNSQLGIGLRYRFNDRDYADLSASERKSVEDALITARGIDQNRIKEIVGNKLRGQKQELIDFTRRNIKASLLEVRHLGSKIDHTISGINNEINHINDLIALLEEERMDVRRTTPERASEILVKVGEYKRQIEELEKKKDFLNKYSKIVNKFEGELLDIDGRVQAGEKDLSENINRINEINNISNKVANKITNKDADRDMTQGGPSNDEPTNDEPSNDNPTNDQPSNDEPSNDEPSNDEPSNDEPSNDDGPQVLDDDSNNLQPPAPQNSTHGLSDDVKDVMKNAIKCISSRNAGFHKLEIATILPGVAAIGLGLATGAPSLAVLGGAVAAVGGGAMVVEVVTKAMDSIKYGAIMHKYKKVAKTLTKQLKAGDKQNGLEVVVKTDKDTGEIRFAITHDGEEVADVNRNFTGDLLVQGPLGNDREYHFTDFVSKANELLDKEFAYMNDDKKRKKSKYYDKYGIPKVDVDNLEAAYVEYGGYKFGNEKATLAELDLSGKALSLKDKVASIVHKGKLQGNNTTEEVIDEIAERNTQALGEGTTQVNADDMITAMEEAELSNGPTPEDASVDTPQSADAEDDVLDEEAMEAERADTVNSVLTEDDVEAPEAEPATDEEAPTEEAEVATEEDITNDINFVISETLHDEYGLDIDQVNQYLQEIEVLPEEDYNNLLVAIQSKASLEEIDRIINQEPALDEGRGL